LVSALLAAVPAAGSTTDPYRSQQWALARIKAPEAWSVSTGAGVTIAVVDTGVDLTHPDLSRNVIDLPDSDFVEPHGTCTKSGTGKNATSRCTQDGAMDKNGHGTHVAGIAAAQAGNGKGIAGVAPSAKILPVRVLDAKGSGTTERVARGVRYAVDKGASVINLSLGFLSGTGEVDKVTGSLEPIYTAVDYAYERGAVVVFAAGNDSVPLCAEPAAHPRVMCVGATDRSDMRAWYSNGDATLTRYFVTAPGGEGFRCSSDVLSTYLRTASHSSCSPERGYEAVAGTSMAAPHVAGVAALLAAKGLTNKAIMDCIIKTTDDLGMPGRDPVYGYGRVNALKAVTNC
jgi:serine protease